MGDRDIYRVILNMDSKMGHSSRLLLPKKENKEKGYRISKKSFWDCTIGTLYEERFAKPHS